MEPLAERRPPFVPRSTAPAGLPRPAGALPYTSRALRIPATSPRARVSIVSWARRWPAHRPGSTLSIPSIGVTPQASTSTTTSNDWIAWRPRPRSGLSALPGACPALTEGCRTGRSGVAPKGGWTVGWTVAFSGGPEVLPQVWTPQIGHSPFLQVTPLWASRSRARTPLSHAIAEGKKVCFGAPGPAGCGGGGTPWSPVDRDGRLCLHSKGAPR
jgi:hypothetical protein